MTYEANRPVKTSVRTFAIIERLSRTETIQLSRLADELDMSKGIVHNHISTLRELGYVRKHGDSYRLSAKFLSVGVRARSHTRLFSVAHDPLVAFADRFDTGVILCEPAGGDCVVIDAEGLPTAVDVTVGTSIPITESIVGGILAAEAAAFDDLSESPTAYDPAAVDEAIIERGYIVGPLSSETAVDCIAVPVCEETGDCIGAVGVLLPTGASEQRSDRLVEASVELRTRIEGRFGSGWEATRSFATEKHSWIS